MRLIGGEQKQRLDNYLFINLFIYPSFSLWKNLIDLVIFNLSWNFLNSFGFIFLTGNFKIQTNKVYYLTKIHYNFFIFIMTKFKLFSWNNF